MISTVRKADRQVAADRLLRPKEDLSLVFGPISFFLIVNVTLPPVGALLHLISINHDDFLVYLFVVNHSS